MMRNVKTEMRNLVCESNNGVKIKCKIFITFNIVNNIFSCRNDFSYLKIK